MTHRIGRFTATAADGTAYTIDQLVWYILIRPADGPPELLREGPMLLTAGGQAVDRISPGVYQVVSTGLMLRSSDPAAP
jgi:hypothetical protein